MTNITNGMLQLFESNKINQEKIFNLEKYVQYMKQKHHDSSTNSENKFKIENLINQRNDIEIKIKSVEDKIDKIDGQLNLHKNYNFNNEKKDTEDLHENYSQPQTFFNICQYCGARFMNIESFESHMKCHEQKEYKCTLCEAMFDDNYNLQLHTQYKHSYDPRFFKFYCGFCGLRFKEEETLQIHVKSHKLSMYKCKICDNKFDNRTILEKHIIKEHENTTTLKKCEHCGKEFHTKWRLNKHMILHGDKFVRKCHFYNNDKDCPFEKIGCKFLHSQANECKFQETCSHLKCQYRHQNRSPLDIQKLHNYEVGHV